MTLSRNILRAWDVCRPSFRWFVRTYGNQEIQVDADFIKAAMEQDSGWALTLLEHAVDKEEASFISKTSGWSIVGIENDESDKKDDVENGLCIAFLGDPNSKKIRSFLECMGAKA